MGKALTLPGGLKGFDTNQRVTPEQAATMRTAGYAFAIRYLGRTSQGPHDLSLDEVVALTGVGLAVMAVQHVESESSWDPSGNKGGQYGFNAGQFAKDCRLALGTNVWLDLEGVNLANPVSAIVTFCTNWFSQVSVAGFTPGLYVGWHCGLTPAQLHALPFEHYWAAYNLNKDQEPSTRGCQMRQHAALHGDVPAGVNLTIDVNTTHADAVGGLPIAHVPDQWSAQ